MLRETCPTVRLPLRIQLHSCYLYANKVIQVIQQHETQYPLFLYWAQQACQSPAHTARVRLELHHSLVILSQVPHAPYNEMPELEDMRIAHKGRRIAQGQSALVLCSLLATSACGLPAPIALSGVLS